MARLFGALSARVVGNPISKEELEEIRKYIEKDVLTLEEAYKFKELAWKLVEEYRREFPDVWKIYWYAAAWAARIEKENRRVDATYLFNGASSSPDCPATPRLVALSALRPLLGGLGRSAWRRR